ncbi:unnamed protein product [Brachionus calyciflorus]|uniref:Uncharacterized protein n=1 Tax=Brachionus calyciflorus TaxID=104777 RepID=A0A813N5I2_9BILA|nr:unnamed protein product [Brachionus calyciflorus]
MVGGSRPLEISGIKNFSELNPDCISDRNYLPDQINISPWQPIVLDSDIKVNLSNFLNNLSFSIVRFKSIKALDCNSYILKSFDKMKYVKLEFYYSNLKVLQDKKEACKFKTVENSFKKIKFLSFALSVTYFKKTCPLVFSYLDISVLTFNGLSNTFLKKNILEFQEIANSSNIYKIKNLKINVYKYVLSKRLLDSNIFNNTDIRIEGLVDKIEADVFSKVIPKSLIVKTEDFLSLFQDGGKWLNSINFNIEVTIEFEEKYQFPNRDLCFFRNISNSNSFFLNIPLTLLDVNCSCTIIHIFSSYFKNKVSQDYSMSWYILKHLKLIGCFSANLLNSCHLNEKLNQCNTKNFDIASKNYYLLDISLYFDFLSSIFSQIISFFGIVFNIISILVLSSELKSKKTDASSINNLMMYNSLINLAYFLINFFHIINRCVLINGIFCSKIYQSLFAQYYNIYMVEFLGGILKIWSNLSLILISMKRLKFVDSFIWLKKVRLVKCILIVTILFSILINLEKLQLIVVNKNVYFLDSEMTNEFPERNKVLSFLIQKLFKGNDLYTYKEGIILYVLNVIHFSINDVVLFIIVTAFDLKLIQIIRKQVLQRIKLKTVNTNFENLKYRVSYAILINSSFEFLLKILHFCINAWLFITRIKRSMNTQNICYIYPKMCTNFQETSEFLNLLSSSTNIFLFYNLNKNFRSIIKKKIFLVKNLENDNISKVT